MARQRDAAGNADGSRGRRHRRAARSAPARSKAGARSSTTCASCARGARLRARVRARHRAAARHPRNPPRSSARTMLTGDDVLECADFDDTHRRQRLAARKARRRQRRLGMAADSRIARLQPDAVPDAAAARERGGVDNLLVAGRCAGMTHEGQSAARVSAAPAS